MLFFIFWLKPIIGLLLGFILASSLGMLLNNNQKDLVLSPFATSTRGIVSHDIGKHARREDSNEPSVSIWLLALIIAVALAWCVLGGQGNMFYQSYDWESRNALFRDLITHRWPVRYAIDHGWLCYYIAHWLPAAFAGKVLTLMGLSRNLVWTVANIFLLIWTACGIVLVLLHIVSVTASRTTTQVLICILLPILFSTPDIVGILLTGDSAHTLKAVHLEQWSANIQFSSLTTCLFWVFNQAVIPWICTLCFLRETTFDGYLLFFVCCLFAGPLPAIGLAILMAGYGIYRLFHTSEKPSLLRSAFSASNLLSLVPIAVLALYYLANSTSAADAESMKAIPSLLPLPFYFPSEPFDIYRVLIFILVEVLALPIALRACSIRGPILTISFYFLLLCPWITISKFPDFCMRTSIPALLCLCVFSAKVLTSYVETRPPRHLRLPIVSLLVILLLGSATPMIEFYRGISTVARYGVEKGIRDPYKTFDSPEWLKKDSDWPRSNYVADSSSNSFFFKHLAQR